MKGLTVEMIRKYIFDPQIKSMEAEKIKNFQAKSHIFQFCAAVIL